MAERTKIGPYVDADLWQKFREQTEGEGIGEELDKALRAYVENPRRQRIKAFVAENIEKELPEEENSGEVVSGA